ncbi:MAG: OpgC domain-containing protein [Pseudomonadota bacterium]
MQNRIVGIDLARAIAILLVTWKHSMASFGASGLLSGPAHYGLEVLMQLATPTFLILFGAMLELVYKPRFETASFMNASQRLFKRARDCYGYYCLTIIVFFLVMGTYSWKALPFVFTGFISVPYSNLIAFYTAAIFLAPFLIIARLRWGLFPIVGAALLIHLAHPIFAALPPAPELFGRDYLQHMSGYLYGRGVNFAGPSLIHGLSLVCLGMLFGHGLNRSSKADATTQISPRVSIYIAVAALSVVAIYWNWTTPLLSLEALANTTLRMQSHPMYFSVGIVGAIGLTWLCIYIYDVRRIRVGRSLQVFGRRSLFAFAIGNILAYIAPAELALYLGVWGSVTGLFATICALTLIYDQYEMYRSKVVRLRLKQAV